MFRRRRPSHAAALADMTAVLGAALATLSALRADVAAIQRRLDDAHLTLVRHPGLPDGTLVVLDRVPVTAREQEALTAVWRECRHDAAPRPGDQLHHDGNVYQFDGHHWRLGVEPRASKKVVAQAKETERERARRAERQEITLGIIETLADQGASPAETALALLRLERG